MPEKMKEQLKVRATLAHISRLEFRAGKFVTERDREGEEGERQTNVKERKQKALASGGLASGSDILTKSYCWLV